MKPRDTLPFTGWHNATRQDLAQIEAELGFTKGAEIGVAEGRHARMLLRTIPNLHLLLVDPYSTYGRTKQELCSKREEGAKVRLAGKNVKFMKMTSMEAAREVPEGSLDFVYIDGRHEFDFVMQDIIEWNKRVRRGGIVAGHDYYHFYQSGVIEAVNAYTQAHCITEWYLTKEKEATWLWVKND